MRSPRYSAVSVGLVLFVVACSGPQAPRGGTPGPPAVSCTASEEEGPCEQVRVALESVRSAIGGAPSAEAEADARLVQGGPAVASYLVEVLGDRDAPVALFAASALAGLGEVGLATDRCTEREGRMSGSTPEGRPIDEEICRQAATLARDIEELRADGSWRGRARPRGGSDASEMALTLRLRGEVESVEGQLCVNDAVACHHIEGVRTGRRLELEAGTGGGGTTSLVLAMSPESPAHLRGTLMLPGCRCDALSMAACDCGLDVLLSPGR